MKQNRVGAESAAKNFNNILFAIINKMDQRLLKLKRSAAATCMETD